MKKVYFTLFLVIFLAACNHNPTHNGLIADAEGDHEKAVAQWQIGAKEGNATAQYRLGLAYKRGKGVIQDYEQAYYWFQKSANQKHSNALNDLGVLYAKGNGVRRDIIRAIYHYRQGALQGSGMAMSNIGNLYRRGRGVVQDDTRALFWLLLAQKYGFEKAQIYLDRFRHTLTDAQVSNITQRVKKFVVTDPQTEPYLRIKELEESELYTG